MKKLSVFLCALVLLFGVVGTAYSGLQTIGTASYMGSDYNLIYEDDSIDGGLVWLAYTRTDRPWQDQVNWASGLNNTGVLTCNLNPGVDVSWGGDWRLPITDESQCNLSGTLFGYEGPDATGYHDYFDGYNMVNSELGHLYYESLGNLGYVATDGTEPQLGWGLNNTGPFNILPPFYFWSGTEYSGVPDFYAWVFNFEIGRQEHDAMKHYNAHAMAVRPADVSPVPIPSAIWLLGSAFFGLVGFRKKFKKGGDCRFSNSPSQFNRVDEKD